MYKTYINSIIIIMNALLLLWTALFYHGMPSAGGSKYFWTQEPTKTVLLCTELLSKPGIYWQSTQRGSKRRKSKYIANKNVSGWSEMTKTKQGEERQKEEQKNYVGNYTGISKIQL